MSEENSVQCPACTAELTPETVECPWCGHLMTPKAGEILAEAVPEQIKEWFEPEPILSPAEPAQAPESDEPAQPPLPEESASDPPVPQVSVFPVDEPGLTELTPLPGLSYSNRLKVMGKILIIFSFLALVFFVFQVFQDKLPRLVIVVPFFGILIGFISVVVSQKR